ncbi:hypothetical protein [Actinokineospora bangkokensis]|uniref:Uncharacterized protein n=1 Tax=Actinokineospora bangkokensis TaxID=1193682 RepID=A0A1Q9LEP3_9PSEU|nr:hypothetical protein [Actinokineospora bangkokensis]OLR90493.1 hypothetical protein BJP25_28060 [Actinokineospora bangkokensis]
MDPPPAAGQPAPTSPGTGADGCRPGEACTVLGTEVIGTTHIQLIGDPGGRSGRLRIGGSASLSLVVELTVAGSGVTLDQGSLTCVGAGISACLVRGTGPTGVVGQAVVGRSGTWSPINRAFTSTAGYLALNQVYGDSTPEVLAATCTPGCARVYLQVSQITGPVLGCTQPYPRLTALPRYPDVSVPYAALRPCPT